MAQRLGQKSLNKHSGISKIPFFIIFFNFLSSVPGGDMYVCIYVWLFFSTHLQLYG